MFTKQTNRVLIVPAPMFATMRTNGYIKTIRIIPAKLGVKGDFGKIQISSKDKTYGSRKR